MECTTLVLWSNQKNRKFSILWLRSEFCVQNMKFLICGPSLRFCELSLAWYAVAKQLAQCLLQMLACWVLLSECSVLSLACFTLCCCEAIRTRRKPPLHSAPLADYGLCCIQVNFLQNNIYVLSAEFEF